MNEKIGIYTEDEILEHLTEGEGRGFLGRSMYDAIFDKIHALKTENEQLKQENAQLKENYDRIYNENCKLREEHNITDISLLDENQELKQKYLNAVADYETTMFEKEQSNSLVNSC